MANSSNNKPDNPYQPPQSMQDSEMQAEVASTSYPIAKVVLGYGILGSLFWFAITIGSMLLDGTLVRYNSSIFVAVVVAIVIGLFPALLLGSVFAWQKVIITSYRNDIKIGLWGFLVSTSLMLLLLLIWFSFAIPTKALLICLPIGLLEVIITVIVGRLVLPKK